MHAASDLIKTALDPQSMKSERPSQPEKLPQPLLDKLWLKMAEIYGRRWTGSFGVSVDQSHAWAATLGGLTGEQIAVGLNALACTEDKQLQDWPPAAPQFSALCLSRDPEAFGLPSEEKAYREACRRAEARCREPQAGGDAQAFCPEAGGCQACPARTEARPEACAED